MFVRWSNLMADEQELRRLPGYRDDAVVRRFDAPGAINTRFYEVNARSILNRVPDRSPMPFRWTINPYRGCTHACSYCMSGDTQILMAGGRTRRLSEVHVGDEIYGTVRKGAYRRFTVTRVLDKWSSIKPAYAIGLADGTTLIASDEHRFLTGRGWKHVLGAEWGRHQRPHLTLNSKLLGSGGCVAAPAVDDGYRRGYLCGMIRGDGSLGSYSYAKGETHRFRLALADQEALDRTTCFLADFGAATTEFQFAVAAGNRRGNRAIRTQRRSNIELISSLIEWPRMPSLSWVKGFLAGIFDAEGSGGKQALRIANTDPVILAWIKACLGRFGFDYAVETRGLANGLTCIRLRGGLPERMRFLLGTDPAITRKRMIDGIALKNDAKLQVESIRPLGIVMRMYDITTGTGDFIANGVVSHNCFARPTHEYLGFDAGRDFEREIVVKVNAPEVLRTELARPSWGGEHVALGTNTDPYQWVEGRYKLMEGIWEALRDAENPCSVLTKSPLLLRDVRVMLEIAKTAGFTACLSIPTLDERAWRATEPHTPHPRKRLEAVAELNRAGIPTGVLIAPLMPGINDAPSQIEPLIEAATDAQATGISGVALHLRGTVRNVFIDWLRGARPDLVEHYEELYARGAYAPPSERARLSALVRVGKPPEPFGFEGARRPGRKSREARGEQRSSRDARRERVAQGTLF
jgi:DNA repair photolyase